MENTLTMETKKVVTNSRHLVLVTKHESIDVFRKMKLYARVNSDLHLKLSNNFFLKAKIPGKYTNYLFYNNYLFYTNYLFSSTRNIMIEIIENEKGNLLWEIKEDQGYGDNMLILFLEQEPFFIFKKTTIPFQHEKVILQYQGYTTSDLGKFLDSRALLFESESIVDSKLEILPILNNRILEELKKIESYKDYPHVMLT